MVFCFDRFPIVQISCCCFRLKVEYILCILLLYEPIAVTEYGIDRHYSLNIISIYINVDIVLNDSAHFIYRWRLFNYILMGTHGSFLIQLYYIRCMFSSHVSILYWLYITLQPFSWIHKTVSHHWFQCMPMS